MEGITSPTGASIHWKSLGNGAVTNGLAWPAVTAHPVPLQRLLRARHKFVGNALDASASIANCIWVKPLLAFTTLKKACRSYGRDLLLPLMLAAVCTGCCSSTGAECDGTPDHWRSSYAFAQI